MKNAKRLKKKKTSGAKKEKNLTKPKIKGPVRPSTISGNKTTIRGREKRNQISREEEKKKTVIREGEGGPREDHGLSPNSILGGKKTIHKKVVGERRKKRT